MSDNIHTVAPIFNPYHKTQFQPIILSNQLSDENMTESKNENCCTTCCQYFDSIMSCCCWCYICSIIAR